MHTKKCSKCGEIKPTSAFTPSSAYRDGFCGQGRSCKNEYAKKKNAEKRASLPKKLSSQEKAVLSGRRSCSACGVDKAITEFTPDTRLKSGYTSRCKECTKEYMRKYHEKNGQKYRDRRNERYRTDPEFRKKILESTRTESYKKYRKEYQKSEDYKKAQDRYRDSGKRAATERKKWRDNPQFRLRKNVAARMRQAFYSRGANKSGNAIFDILPYTLEELMAHLEAQFTEGMSWDNYGEWHVDHIKPDSFFKYASVCDPGFMESWKLSNLQPLWAEDNLKKSNNMVFNV